MAVLEILAYPNEFLRKKAQPVTRFDEPLRALVRDMEDTMAAEDGVGLAATQIGADLQLLLVHPYAFKGDEARIRALDVEGRPFELEGEGLSARALLHEIDHLNGVVMIDHVSFLQRQRALKKHQKNQADLAAIAKKKKADARSAPKV
jgi:peptide deformylase